MLIAPVVCHDTSVSNNGGSIARFFCVLLPLERVRLIVHKQCNTARPRLFITAKKRAGMGIAEDEL